MTLDIQPDLFDELDYRSGNDRCIACGRVGCRRCGTSSKSIRLTTGKAIGYGETSSDDAEVGITVADYVADRGQISGVHPWRCGWRQYHVDTAQLVVPPHQHAYRSDPGRPTIAERDEIVRRIHRGSIR